MLNLALAALAAVLWSTAYGWYFAPDIRRWLRARRKQRDRHAPAAPIPLTLRSPPPRPAAPARARAARRGPEPLFPPPPPAPRRHQDNVVPFPARPRRRPDLPGGG